MSDTTAPVLLGLTLPSTIDLSSGTAAIEVGARAQDEAGGSGIRSVIIEFDKRIWLENNAGNSNILLIDNVGNGDDFSDDTPSSAIGIIRFSNLTQSGSYDIKRVVVEDMAGNRTIYDPGQLQAFGIPSAITVTGGIVDKGAPTLVSLSLPASIDLGSGFSQQIYPTAFARDTGGAGVRDMWIAFDKPLVLTSGPVDGLYLRSLSRVEDGSDTYLRDLPTLSRQTPAGVYNITSVLVSDYLGNFHNYSPAQLEAMGINTAITIKSDTPPGPTPAPTPPQPAALLSLSLAEQGGVLTVTPESWGSAEADSFTLQVRYNGDIERFAGASLTGGATGELGVTQDGGMLTITGKNVTGAGLGTGIAVTMSPLRANALSSFEFSGFSLGGVDHRDTGAARRVDYYRASDAADRIDFLNLPELADGRGGLDTLRVHAGRDDYRITKASDGFVLASSFGAATRLANIERIAFDDGHVALDVDGASGQVYRLYQAAFDRAPDLAGLGYWIGRMDAGVSLAQVAASFVSSAEFGALLSPTAGARDFVTAMYDNVLQRQPDPAGLAFWIDALGRGLGRADMLLQFSESPENVARVVGSVEHGIDFLP